MALSPDGTRVVAVSDETFMLWDVATGQTVRTSEGRYSSEGPLAFSPDGARIVWGHGKKLTLWDAAAGSYVRTLDARPMEAISAVALSPDGNRILSAGTILSAGRRVGGTVGLWDVATGQLVRIFGGHSGRVRSVAFSLDGTRVLSGGEVDAVGVGDTTLKLWGDDYGPPAPHTFEGHSASVTSVAFSRDGRRIFSGSRDGTIRIWDPQSGGLLATLLAARHDEWLIGEWVTITPEGFFDASTEATATGMLSIVRGLEVFSIDRSYQVLHRPDLVREKLAGDPNGKVKEAAAEIDTKLQLK